MHIHIHAIDGGQHAHAITHIAESYAASCYFPCRGGAVGGGFFGFFGIIVQHYVAASCHGIAQSHAVAAQHYLCHIELHALHIGSHHKRRVAARHAVGGTCHLGAFHFDVLSQQRPKLHIELCSFGHHHSVAILIEHKHIAHAEAQRKPQSQVSYGHLPACGFAHLSAYHILGPSLHKRHIYHYQHHHHQSQKPQ